MAKEISTSAKEDQAFEDNEHAKFATDVIKLYEATIAGKLADHDNADSDDVRSVAFGLATLKQAVDYFLQRCPDELVAAHGMHHANAILEALTTPGMHPVWRHIKALQGRKYMPHLAPDVATVQTIRDMLGGIVLAYKEASGVDSVLKAAEAVADGIKPAAFKFSADQARKWAGRENAGGYERRFLAYTAAVPNCNSPTERVLIVGRAELYPLVSVPKAKAD